MWCCVWYYLFFHEIDKHVWIVWPFNDLSIDKAIASICRKSRPLFWSLCRWYKVCWLNFWRPTIVMIKSLRTFICCGFINVYELIIPQLWQWNIIFLSKALIAFSSYSLKVSKSVMAIRYISIPFYEISSLARAFCWMYTLIYIHWIILLGNQPVHLDKYKGNP